jgi:hypothetical protein
VSKSIKGDDDEEEKTKNILTLSHADEIEEKR